MTTTAVVVAKEDAGHTGIPYERIVQWLAGPVAIIAGAIAVWLDNHFGLLGKAGLGKDQTAKAIVDVATFGIGAIVTYLSHAKWMTNLAAWWQNQTEGSIAVTEEQEQIETEAPTPAEQPDKPDEPEAPFVDEPGYDDPGPGVEPDQDLDDKPDEEEAGTST